MYAQSAQYTGERVIYSKQLHWSCILILISCTSLAQETPETGESSFEKALRDLYNRKPYLFGETKKPQEEEKDSSWLSYENCKKYIDMSAMISAFIRIYSAHQKMDAPESDTDWLDKTISYVCPEMLQRIAKQSKFFKESIEIVIETIILKTVAHMILYCSKGDGFDLIKTTC